MNNAICVTQGVDADQGGVAPGVPAWREAPLRTKLAMMILLAAIGGSFVGMVEVRLGHMVWPMWLGLVVLVGGLLWLGTKWICLPFERLLRQVDRVSSQERPTKMDISLSGRTDEVGRIARGIDRCVTRDLHDFHKARQLRRSLDQGVEQATRKATRHLREMAMHDPLTGLGNRRFLDEHLDQLVAPAQASNTELVCIAIDMDNFKQVNDTLGHASGDDLLQLVAELIRGQKRLQDYGVRLGGDEFIVLMPGCGHRHAQAFAQRLRSLFQHEVRTLLSGQVRPDLSMGIAALSDGPTTGRQLLQAADEHLYAAKRAGKGQAVAGGQVRP